MVEAALGNWARVASRRLVAAARRESVGRVLHLDRLHASGGRIEAGPLRNWPGSRRGARGRGEREMERLGRARQVCPGCGGDASASRGCDRRPGRSRAESDRPLPGSAAGQ